MNRQEFIIQDNNYKERIKKSFIPQYFMELIEAKLDDIQHGYCEIPVPYRKELSQQHGFFMRELLAHWLIIRQVILHIV
jgi:hypothetical protein